MRADIVHASGCWIPLAALPAEPVRRRRARARGHVERRVVDVAAVVERRVPLARPVVAQAVLAEQQRRVVELVGHVVEAAAHVERRPVRHHPHRVAGDAHAVAVAARQREEPAVGRILLVQVGLELAVAREDLPVVADVHVDALREVPVVDVLEDAALPVVDVARQVRQRDLLQHLQRHRIEPRLRDDVVGKRRPDDAAGGVERRRERVVDGAHAAVQHRLAEVAAALGSVGTVRTIEIGRLSSHCSNDVKQKILLRLIGPPNVPPYICSFGAAQRRRVLRRAARIVGSVIAFRLGIAAVVVADPRGGWCPTSCSG